jgi:chromosome segregation ATPase
LERLNKELMAANSASVPAVERQSVQSSDARIVELEALVLSLRDDLVASNGKATQNTLEAEAFSRRIRVLEQALLSAEHEAASAASRAECAEKALAVASAEAAAASSGSFPVGALAAEARAAEARAAEAEAIVMEAEEKLSRGIEAAKADRLEAESKLVHELELVRRELQRAEQSRAEMAADLNVANRKLNGATERIVLMTGSCARANPSERAQQRKPVMIADIVK